MDEGCLVEEGSHTELMALKGIYYDTYKRQEVQAEEREAE
jgi:ABC-type multidrug transport system fused ATPase/permease subunit